MSIRKLLPFLAALALGACQDKAPDIVMPDMAKTIHVDRVRVQHDAAFAPGSPDIAPAEAARLQAFLDQSGIRPHDRVYLAPSPGDRLAAARIGRVVTLLARRGIGAETVAVPPAGVAPDHLLVELDRYVVTPPSCPDWSDSPATPHDNVPHSNFGCATANNLALMVDNPRDLMMGRALGPADGDPALSAVQRYRNEAVKPLLGASAPGGAPGAAASPTPGMSGSPPPGGGGPAQ